MWDHEYDEKIFKHFTNNSYAYVYARLGFKDKGYELRLFASFLIVDIFLMYKINETYLWNGYQGDKKFYRQYVINVNKSSLCSGELLGAKYIVPCNPEKYLSFQYGEEKWRNPMPVHYFNFKSIIRLPDWTDDEWPYVVRYYKKNGDVDTITTLTVLNKNVNKSYTALPPDKE